VKKIDFDVSLFHIMTFESLVANKDIYKLFYQNIKGLKSKQNSLQKVNFHSQYKHNESKLETPIKKFQEI
jgi:hypothetical protein